MGQADSNSARPLTIIGGLPAAWDSPRILVDTATATANDCVAGHTRRQTGRRSPRADRGGRVTFDRVASSRSSPEDWRDLPVPWRVGAGADSRRRRVHDRSMTIVNAVVTRLGRVASLALLFAALYGAALIVGGFLAPVYESDERVVLG